MPKIIPHLWFDNQAVEAAEFYTGIFPDSHVTGTSRLFDTPSGDCDLVYFELAGHPFQAISAGPEFVFNPSISFMLNFDPSRDNRARERLDESWNELSRGGKALMPLDAYPFSKRYGWVQDRFGLSWQLILSNPEGEPRPFIVPSLMFTKAMAGKAEEAIDFYASVFKNAKRGATARYPAGSEPDKEGTLMYADVMLENQWFAAMDSAQRHDFSFNEAVSLIVSCDDQEEIDYYWSRLSAVPGAEQCGWLKDRYGVSWQISPAVVADMLANGTREQIDRVTRAFLKMKKFDVATLEREYLKG